MDFAALLETASVYWGDVLYVVSQPTSLAAILPAVLIITLVELRFRNPKGQILRVLMMLLVALVALYNSSLDYSAYYGTIDFFAEFGPRAGVVTVVAIIAFVFLPVVVLTEAGRRLGLEAPLPAPAETPVNPA